MIAEMKWMSDLRRAFGFLILVSLLPTSIHLYQTGHAMVAKNPGLFLLEYMWVLAPVMAVIVGTWMWQGCQDIKEGYWLYWFFAALSLVSCASLGSWWLFLSRAIAAMLIIGAVVYHVIWSSVNGAYSFMSTEPTKVVRHTIVVLTVFLSYFSGYATAQWTQSVYGIMISVLVPVFATLVGVKVWRNDYGSKHAVPILMACFIAGILALIYLKAWVILVFSLAVFFGLTVMLPDIKDRNIATKSAKGSE